MPTNEERQEVAARLRYIGDHGGPEWGTAGCCIAECIGEDNYPLWGGSSPLFTKLAYLIEPEPERTCENESSVSGIFTCSYCGADFYDTEISGDWNYCPNCGARVVEE